MRQTLPRYRHTRSSFSYDVLENAVHEGRHSRALVIGNAADATIDDRLRERGVSVERIARDTPQATCIALCERSLTETRPSRNGRRELCIASLSLSQWPELLGCGAYAAKRDSALLLENPTDLDDIAQCLDFVERSSAQVDKLVFIGKESGVARLDRELLVESLDDARSGR